MSCRPFASLWSKYPNNYLVYIWIPCRICICKNRKNIIKFTSGALMLAFWKFFSQSSLSLTAPYRVTPSRMIRRLLRAISQILRMCPNSFYIAKRFWLVKTCVKCSRRKMLESVWDCWEQVSLTGTTALKSLAVLQVQDKCSCSAPSWSCLNALRQLLEATAEAACL